MYMPECESDRPCLQETDRLRRWRRVERLDQLLERAGCLLPDRACARLSAVPRQADAQAPGEVEVLESRGPSAC